MTGLIEEHKRLNRVINDLLSQRNAIRQQIAEDNCPFKIGDRLVATNSPEFREGVKVVVSGIGWRHSVGDYRLYVKKIKKNGDLYANSTEVFFGKGLRKDQ